MIIYGKTVLYHRGNAVKWILLFFMLGSSLWAEMENHYIPGTHGLNSAMKPDCGFIYTGVYTLYHVDHLKNREGKKIHLNPCKKDYLDVQIFQNFFSYYTPLCLLGGKWGFQVNVPFQTTALDVIPYHHSFDVNHQLRLADVYFEPINIRYNWCQFDLFVAYGFYMPTGRVHRNCLNNAGYGNWGNMLTVAGTWYIDCDQLWTFSFYSTYEVHGRKRHLNFTPGQNLCVDWGLGRNFGKYFTLGFVGYYEQQTTHDKGGDVPFRLHSAKDQVVAFGGEFGVVVPQVHFGVHLRYEEEYFAKCRTEGRSFIAVGSLGF